MRAFEQVAEIKTLFLRAVVQYGLDLTERKQGLSNTKNVINTLATIELNLFQLKLNKMYLQIRNVYGDVCNICLSKPLKDS